MKIAFIGGGNMGEAILAAMLNKKLAISKDITVSDVSEARRHYLMQKYFIAVSTNNIEAIKDKDIILLAIKPQTLTDITTELKGHLKPNQLVISIIAGARLGRLTEGLNHHSIVRSMPNTPAQNRRRCDHVDHHKRSHRGAEKNRWHYPWCDGERILCKR